MSEQTQALCFFAGANSIFYGEKLLTTPNPDADSDMALFDKLGLKPLAAREVRGHAAQIAAWNDGMKCIRLVLTPACRISGCPIRQMKTPLPPLPVVATEGCRIKLADGRELIDGIASWWSACHGYNHPHIVAAIEAQLHTMPHVMFGGLVHEPALTLAKRLTDIAPQGLNRVFFADSGSVAVEVALKIALQYWRNKGKPQKDRFICFRDGYHGDTLGAMSVSDPEKSLHKAFRNSVIKQYVVDIPARRIWLCRIRRVACGRAWQYRRAHHRAAGAGRGRHAISFRRYAGAKFTASPKNTISSSSPTKSPPAFTAPAACSPATKRASRPTSCAWAKR